MVLFWILVTIDITIKYWFMITIVFVVLCSLFKLRSELKVHKLRKFIEGGKYDW